MVKQWLFKVARSRFATPFMGFAFAHLTPFMPLDRLVENEHLILFKHPVPSWDIHWLAVPKQARASFLALDLQVEKERMLLVMIVQTLVTLAQTAGVRPYSIIVNGGRYQDVPQLHFHLAQGQHLGQEQYTEPPPATHPLKQGPAWGYPHPTPADSFHYIVTTQGNSRPFSELDLSQPAAQAQLLACLQTAQRCVEAHELTAFRLIVNNGYRPAAPKLTFHLLSHQLPLEIHA